MEPSVKVEVHDGITCKELKAEMRDAVNAVAEGNSAFLQIDVPDKTGTEGFQEASRILRFNKEQEEKGQAILKILERMSVEEGVSLLEKCIFQHSYFGWERGYMKEPAPYGVKE